MNFSILFKRITVLALLVSLCGTGFAQKAKEKKQKEKTANSFWLDYRCHLPLQHCQV